MGLYRLIFIIGLISSSSAFASTSKLTLFAVDLSLSDIDKGLAFDVISETILEASLNQSIGLVLFDDTVRNYVAPQSVDAEHIKNLNNVIVNAPDSVRSTSNIAVGIERAIDGLQLDNTGTLVLFARGVIDTEKQDSRARFYEWLDVILLPQATKSNIAITLVVPDDQSINSTVRDSFEKVGTHKLVASKPGTLLTPELIGLLNIPNRNYGSNSVQANSADTTLVASPESIVVLAEQVQGDLVTKAKAGVSQASVIDNVSSALKTNGSFLMRVGLLILALAMLITLLFRYFRGKRQLPTSDHSITMTSSTYLPLTERPGRSKGQWSDNKTASERAQPSSINREKGASSQASTGNSSQVDASSSDDADPWD
jgi:hypothetical protein